MTRVSSASPGIATRAGPSRRGRCRPAGAARAPRAAPRCCGVVQVGLKRVGARTTRSLAAPRPATGDQVPQGARRGAGHDGLRHGLDRRPRSRRRRATGAARRPRRCRGRGPGRVGRAPPRACSARASRGPAQSSQVSDPAVDDLGTARRPGPATRPEVVGADTRVASESGTGTGRRTAGGPAGATGARRRRPRASTRRRGAARARAGRRGDRPRPTSTRRSEPHVRPAQDGPAATALPVVGDEQRVRASSSAARCATATSAISAKTAQSTRSRSRRPGQVRRGDTAREHADEGGQAGPTAYLDGTRSATRGSASRRPTPAPAAARSRWARRTRRVVVAHRQVLVLSFGHMAPPEVSRSHRRSRRA